MAPPSSRLDRRIHAEPGSTALYDLTNAVREDDRGPTGVRTNTTSVSTVVGPSPPNQKAKPHGPRRSATRDREHLQLLMRRTFSSVTDTRLT
jgi:hypothetical protein